MCRKLIQVTVFAAVTIGTTLSVSAARPDLIEVQVGRKTYRGKAVAHNSREFWLLQRDGVLRRLPIHSVSNFRSISPRFSGYRAVKMRAELREQFGRKYEVAATRHYLVVGPPDRVDDFAATFEKVYRTFVTFFGARGFRLKSPEFPLVAIVFPTRKEFIAYARKDGVTIASQILGYYQPRTNRVALFDESRVQLGSAASGPAVDLAGFAPVNQRLSARFFGRGDQMNQNLKDTIIHETTHQVAFNTGLHTRIGRTPKWVVEGLATVFEAPGIRNRRGRRGAKSRINEGRLQDFQRFAARSRKARSLARFIAGDDAFRYNIGNAYAEAWALSFFLIETRSQDYSRYLQILTERDPLKRYSSKQRLADFQKAFGSDLDRLEVDYLRFLKRL